MRIATIYPHVSIGSSESPDNALAVLIWETCRRLARTDEVRLIVGGSPGIPETETIEGVRITRLSVFADQLFGQLRRLDGVLFRDPKHPFRSTRAYYYFFDRWAAHHLNRWEPQIVHVHAIPNFLPLLRKRLPNARLILQAHDHRLHDYDRELVGRMLEAADLILGCSRFVADGIASHCPGVAERCSHAYNGVDERFIAIGNQRLEWSQKVLFVGRLSPEKGVHTLIEAFCSVADEFPTATLELIGPDELAPLQFIDPSGDDPHFKVLRDFYSGTPNYAEYLRNLAPPNLSDRIHFLGPMPNTSLPDVFGRAGIFAFPSIWNEPFGMPVVEAMGAGLPVIATDGGAFSETVDDGQTGFLVARGNDVELAEALRALLRSEERRRTMGISGLRRAFAQFTWDRVVSDLRDQYRFLL